MTNGVHFLMKKNKITEIHGWGTFTGPKAIDVKKEDGSAETVTYDNVIIAAGRHGPARARRHAVRATS